MVTEINRLCQESHIFHPHTDITSASPPHRRKNLPTNNAIASMTLDDFEKSLAKEREDRENHDRHQEDKKHRHHHHHHHHHRHRHPRRDDGDHHQRRRKREPSRDGDEEHRRRKHQRHEHHSSDSGSVNDLETPDPATSEPVKGDRVKRDSWMETPSSLDIDYVQRPLRDETQPTISTSSKRDFELKIHDNELNKHHLKELEDGTEIEPDLAEDSPERKVNYTIGDAGSRWRMTKLKGIYRRAEELGRPIEDVAIEQLGDLRSFDDAREEEIELERRERYGPEYVGKEKPNGDLFKERELDAGIRQKQKDRSEAIDPESTVQTEPPSSTTVLLDQTGLNRLKAQMMKAKIRGGPDAERLETEYKNALASFANNKQSDVIVLGAMENRMLAGNRQGEVKPVDTKRGRERGLVEENEDMSIEDMVREERRTRGQAGGDGLRLAERIAKDGKFDNDLDYMDENATKLARRVHKSEVNLKTTAISDFQKMNRILDSCPLCHHEDSDKPPVAPVVSLATRAYLTLPTEPEISDGGASIIPIQHRSNLLECDDDEWEEIRNFMKALTRMYHDQGRSVLFYENAATPHRHRHASMEAVPLPYSLGEIAPQFFKEAILTSDEEWTQHKKIIDTLARSKDGLGKLAFRRTLVKEMPYFHVWFEIDGGLGHVIEDSNRWPKGDLFAREVLGGMLDKGPEVVKKQGRWRRDDPRMEAFRRRWRKFDWTRILTDG